jgi:hypothetical protein
VVGSYRDAAGARHELVVRETADGDWQVLDTCPDGARVIDTLARDQDGRPQAEAIARDYLSTVDRAGTGPAPRDPISEQGGTDARTHRRPRPGPRTSRARGTALPGAAR